MSFKDDIEDLGDTADKQAKMWKIYEGDICTYWEDKELTVKPWPGVPDPSCLAGDIFDIREKLDEHIAALVQMNAQRQSLPFRTDFQEKMGLLSGVADIIDRWVKVQNIWSGLISVFSGGDISKQMPTEYKIF